MSASNKQQRKARSNHRRLAHKLRKSARQFRFVKGGENIAKKGSSPKNAPSKSGGKSGQGRGNNPSKGGKSKGK